MKRQVDIIRTQYDYAKAHNPRLEAADAACDRCLTKTRAPILTMVSSRPFGLVINGLILLNFATLGLSVPQIEDGSIVYQVGHIMSYVFLSIFTAEAVLKIYAFGAYHATDLPGLQHRGYFQDPFNWLDFLSTFIGWIWFDSAFVSGIRILRLLRPSSDKQPASTASKFSLLSYVKVAGLSILFSLPDLCLLALTCFFLILWWAILGVHLFSGGIGHTMCQVPEPYNGLCQLDPGCQPLINQTYFGDNNLNPSARLGSAACDCSNGTGLWGGEARKCPSLYYNNSQIPIVCVDRDAPPDASFTDGLLDHVSLKLLNFDAIAGAWITNLKVAPISRSPFPMRRGWSNGGLKPPMEP